MTIPGEFAGRNGKCTHCGERISVPKASRVSASAWRVILIGFLALTAMATIATAALGAKQLLFESPADFALSPELVARVEKILPAPHEDRFLEIPWRTDLLLARREANEQGKPLYMWLMNGEPLGCT